LRKKKNSSFVTLLVFAIIIAGAIYVYSSKTFERNIPNITMKNNGYWNFKKPLDISIEDESGLKSYSVSIITSKGERALEYEQFINVKESVHVYLEPPKTAYAIKDKEIIISIEANDASMWNFMNGNSIVKEYKLKVDRRRPQLSSVANSYKIKKGGAALVIFKAADENLKEIYIETNFDKRFKAQPFYKEGYYISLLAWPVAESTFRANIIAKDFADNIAKTNVALYVKDKTYRESHIKLSDKFLNGKIAELAEEFAETQGVTAPLERFKIINEDIRLKNENLIHEITSKVPDEMISDFKLNKMYPLKNAAVVAYFGDHRKYTYKGDYISEAYHLGIDMASNAMAKIKPQNSGDVVYSDYNGLYGNMPIIHHGLGLYTLYGHCSSVSIRNGDVVDKGDHIANTGKSGYAMGDHLHFGVLIQGVEVRPAEWMDDTWMKLNIGDVIKAAKEIIDRG
jgi:murein DD-endopeptidase MepM/ murein hydrolase activator NlpD